MPGGRANVTSFRPIFNVSFTGLPRCRQAQGLVNRQPSQVASPQDVVEGSLERLMQYEQLSCPWHRASTVMVSSCLPGAPLEGATATYRSSINSLFEGVKTLVNDVLKSFVTAVK